MNYKIVPVLMMLGIVLAVMVGCARVQVVPKDMQGPVNRDITFSQLLDNPVQYQGQLLVLGGQVLSAKRLKEATQIEVLHLPLSRDLKPVESLQESKGRFLVFQKDFLDPATLPPGTRVTVVGEVSGRETLPLDETTYDFPSLELKHLKVWPPTPGVFPTRPHHPYIYPYWAPYWGPYWWW